jgi:hypothetical protein
MGRKPRVDRHPRKRNGRSCRKADLTPEVQSPSTIRYVISRKRAWPTSHLRWQMPPIRPKGGKSFLKSPRKDSFPWRILSSALVNEFL